MSNQPTPPTPSPPPPLPFDQAKWFEEIRREDAQRAHDAEDEFHNATNKATIDAGQLALRTAILVNGGAAVSVLAFIGGLVGQGKIAAARDIAAVIVWFALGVASALFALAASYFTNYATVEHSASRVKSWVHPHVQDGPKSAKWRCVRNFFHVVAIVFGLASLVLFLVGMYAVRDAITLIK